MSYFAGQGGEITIQTQGQTLVVTLGGQPAYSDAARTAAVTSPAVITSDTTYYFAENGGVTLQVAQPDGTVLTNTTFTVRNGSGLTIAPLPTEAQVGADIVGVVRRDLALAPTGALAETYPRLNSSTANTAVLVSGRLHLTAVWLPAGTTVSSITYVSVTTAAVTPTAQWFALYDSSRVLLGQTADDTSTAWGANAAKTLEFASPVTTGAAGLHYVGIMVAAGTVPSLAGISPHANVLTPAPIANGYSTTGLTGTAPDPAAALTAFASVPYAYLA